MFRKMTRIVVLRPQLELRMATELERSNRPLASVCTQSLNLISSVAAFRLWICHFPFSAAALDLI